MIISRLTQKLSDIDRCPVHGVHFGKTMMTIPASYLDWLRGQPKLLAQHPEMAEYITRHNMVINWELEREGRDD